MFLAASANAGTILVVIALVLAVIALIDAGRAYPDRHRWWTTILLIIAVILIAIALLVGVNAVVD